jgi:hypothetical protein
MQDYDNENASYPHQCPCRWAAFRRLGGVRHPRCIAMRLASPSATPTRDATLSFPLTSIAPARLGDWTINYHTQSGKTISRTDQYDIRSIPYEETSYWFGTPKRDPSITDSGWLRYRRQDGTYWYQETLRKDGQTIVDMASCTRVDGGPPPPAPVVASAPDPAPAPHSLPAPASGYCATNPCYSYTLPKATEALARQPPSRHAGGLDRVRDVDTRPWHRATLSHVIAPVLNW